MGRLIVLDTSILIDHNRGHQPARNALRQALEQEDRFAISVLTKVELLRGMRSNERFVVRRMLATIQMIPVDDEIAEQAGNHARRFRASHHNIEVPDFVIAATAETLDAELWTRNVKHFPMFEGLRSPY